MDALISDIMTRGGWSQSALAARCGVTRQSLSQWMRGEARPTPDVAWRLVAAAREAGVELDLEDIYPPPAGGSAA